MNSALCLHYVPMPSLQAHRIPSMVSTTRPHFTFSHSSRMLSNASTTHLKRHAFSPIIKHKAPSVRASDDSSNDSPIFGVDEKYVLKSLLDLISSYQAPSNKQCPKPLNLPTGLSDEDVAALKKDAIGLLRSGKSSEAEELLRKPLQELIPQERTAEIFSLSMALAEIYIYQGEYEKAKEWMTSFPSKYDHSSDRRLPLYQAIIFTMLDEKDKAKKSWEEYLNRIADGPPHNIPLESDPPK